MQFREICVAIKMMQIHQCQRPREDQADQRREEGREERAGEYGPPEHAEGQKRLRLRAERIEAYTYSQNCHIDL